MKKILKTMAILAAGGAIGWVGRLWYEKNNKEIDFDDDYLDEHFENTNDYDGEACKKVNAVSLKEIEDLLLRTNLPNIERALNMTTDEVITRLQEKREEFKKMPGVDPTFTVLTDDELIAAGNSLANLIGDLKLGSQYFSKIKENEGQQPTTEVAGL